VSLRARVSRVFSLSLSLSFHSLPFRRRRRHATFGSRLDVDVIWRGETTTTLIEKFDVFFQFDAVLLSRAQRLVEFGLYNWSGKRELQRISHKRSRGDGTRSHEFGTRARISEIATFWEMKPSCQTQSVRWNMAIVEWMSWICWHLDDYLVSGWRMRNECFF